MISAAPLRQVALSFVLTVGTILLTYALLS